MQQAYSRLKFLLDERSIDRAELQRRVEEQGQSPSARTLARLADPDRPLERADLRVLGAICRALGIHLGELIVFAEAGRSRIEHLPDDMQQRLADLMDRHNEGQLSDQEREELRLLIEEGEAVSRANASRLIEHRQRIRETGTTSRRTGVG